MNTKNPNFKTDADFQLWADKALAPAIQPGTPEMSALLHDAAVFDRFVIVSHTFKLLNVTHPTPEYVSGFNAQHQIVQRTSDKRKAKTFRTRAAATKWLAQHADCGYGISATDYSVTKYPA